MKNDRPPACKIEIFVTINCEFSLSRLIVVKINMFGEIEMFTTSLVAAVDKVKGHYERK